MNLNFKVYENKHFTELPELIIFAKFKDCFFEVASTFKNCIFENCQFDVKSELINCQEVKIKKKEQN